MSDEPNLGVILLRLDIAEKKLIELKKEVEETEAKRQREEKRRLTTGISVLGSIVLTLFGVIWNYRAVIFPGKTP